MRSVMTTSALFVAAALMVGACAPRVDPEAERAQVLVERPLHALADRLFRLEPSWRIDEKGRGLFLSRPRLDLVVVGRPSLGG